VANKDNTQKDFASQAEQDDVGFFREFGDFLLHNKKWWLTPIILVLIVMAVLIILVPGSPIAQFIYAIF